MDVLNDLTRGVKDKDASPPNTMWQKPEAVATNLAYAFDEGKIFLGHNLYNDLARLIGIKEDRHHLLCCGSRGGKGRSVIIPTLLEYGGSVLAIDPKAELASITSRHRQNGLGQRVFVLDPFKKSAPWCQPFRAYFNPLSILKPDSKTLLEDAGLIADALIIAVSDKDPHWDESARTLIEGVILHVATYRDYETRRTLLTVHELLTKGKSTEIRNPDTREMEVFEGMDGLEAEMQIDPDRAGGAVEAAAIDFFSREERERGSVLSTVRRHIKFLGYQAIRDVLDRGEYSLTFDLADLKTAPEGVTVYLCLPAAQMATCSRWLRLFINLTLDAMEREDTRPDHPVLLCLEEFPVLQYMKQIETASGLMAGFNVKMLVVVQDLSQLKKLYKDGWETFVANAGVLQFFANNDLTTLEYISRRCGKTSFIVTRKSQVTTKQAHDGITGESWATEVFDLITPDEASRVFGRGDPLRRQLVIHAGELPLILSRVNYDEDPHFRGKYDVWPGRT